MNKINIVFMGTPDFSVPTLKKLYSDNRFNISFVVTKIDMKQNRGQKISYSKIKETALELKLDVLQPIKIKEDREVIEKIKNAKPDFIVVVAYGQILSKEILDIPKYACINGHASLLPRYRGASPIQSAILNGDIETGVTSMIMEEGLDSGDILLQEKVVIEQKDTSDILFDKLSNVTANVICDTLINFDNIERIKQEEEKVTYSTIIKKEFGKISFENENATQIDRKVRAYNSWPSAFFEMNGVEYKIWDADVITDDINFNNYKKIDNELYIDNNNIFARCKDGILRINELQKSGKKRMLAKDFINGIKL